MTVELRIISSHISRRHTEWKKIQNCLQFVDKLWTDKKEKRWRESVPFGTYSVKLLRVDKGKYDFHELWKMQYAPGKASITLRGV